MAHAKREGKYEQGEGPRHERGESRGYERRERMRERKSNSAARSPAGAMRISGKTKRK
jgi:hypothetical protein